MITTNNYSTALYGASNALTSNDTSNAFVISNENTCCSSYEENTKIECNGKRLSLEEYIKQYLDSSIVKTEEKKNNQTFNDKLSRDKVFNKLDMLI